MNKRLHLQRGFTLIEMAMVIAIITVASGMALYSIGNFRRRGDFNTATGDLAVALRLARAEAYGRGTPVVLVLDSVGGRYWVIEDPTSAINVVTTTFNPASPVPIKGSLVLSGSFPATVAVAGSAPSAYLAGLPQPYNSVPTSSTTGCTFCNGAGGTNPGYGSITFGIGSGALFSGATPPVAGSITLAASGTTPTGNQMVYAVVGRTGTTETFEVLQ